MNPQEVYERFASGREWSDIGGHLRRLHDYAKGNVFEIGVRGGVSTAALLAGIKAHRSAEFGAALKVHEENLVSQVSHLWSLDIADCGALYDDPDWTFLQGHSVLDCERVLSQIPKELDVLFIDSDHTYECTISELDTYAPLVKKNSGVILLHDTDLNWAGVRRALNDYAAEIGKTPVFHTDSYGMGELRP